MNLPGKTVILSTRFWSSSGDSFLFAETATGRPSYKASDGDRFDILEVSENVIESELQQVSGMQVLVRLEVHPEAFPTGLPMAVW